MRIRSIVSVDAAKQGAGVRRVTAPLASIAHFLLGVRAALLAALVIAALVASAMYGQSPDQSPVAFAQGACKTPIISWNRGIAEGIDLSIRYPDDSSIDPMYEYQLKLDTEPDWPDAWIAVPIKGSLYNQQDGWSVGQTIRGLEPLTVYDYRVRTSCSSTATIRVTTAKTKTYVVTLEDANGMPIDAITEGESATLRVTLDPSEVVFQFRVGISVSLIYRCPCEYELDKPRINRGEVLIAPANGIYSPHPSRTSADIPYAGREAVFTLTAVADALEHHVSPSDDEAEVEVVRLIFQTGNAISGRIRLSDDSLRVVKIIDGPPPIPPDDQAATGSFEIAGGLEVGQVLTATPVNVDDPNGIPQGGFSYTYQWHTGTGANQMPIPGATSSTYTVIPDDIGSQLSVTVSFVDAASFSESLSSSPTNAIPSGPVIRWPSGPNLGPFAHQTLTADTGVMDYADLPQNPSLQFQWIYVDANGARTSSIQGATSPTYGLSPADVGERIQVQVRYVNNASQSVVRRANWPTPAVRDAVDLASPEELTANVAFGVLTVSWTFVSGIGIREPTAFQYRYSPFNPADYTTPGSSERWRTVPGGTNGRSFSLRQNLINSAEYTIQVRSVDELFLAAADADMDLSTTVTTTEGYRHMTRGC